MTALGKLFRTTTFKLTLVYLTVFALFAAFLLGYFALNTRRLITEQITDTVNAEITGLSEQYRQGGIRRLVLVIDARARRPGSSLYLVTTFDGDALAGNVTALPPGILESTGWEETQYRRLDEAEGSATIPSIMRWCACSNCPAAFACWSAATSTSANGFITSCWRPDAGRSPS